jgi:hypothetical protein
VSALRRDDEAGGAVSGSLEYSAYFRALIAAEDPRAVAMLAWAHERGLRARLSNEPPVFLGMKTAVELGTVPQVVADAFRNEFRPDEDSGIPMLGG